MILSKLQEALAEIPKEHQALTEIEEQLRSMISKLAGMPNVLESQLAPQTRAVFFSHNQESTAKDKIDEIAEILRREGHSLHITRIAELLSQRRGHKIIRTTIEPGLNRHIAKTKSPRIAKYGPSTYGLPEWKSKPTLTQMAS